MTKNNIKAILFASLMVAMILPFSAMNMADAAPNENANEKAKDKVAKNQIAKTEKSAKEKALDNKALVLAKEFLNLKDDKKSLKANDKIKLDKIEKRLGEIKAEVGKLEKSNRELLAVTPQDKVKFKEAKKVIKNSNLPVTSLGTDSVRVALAITFETQEAIDQYVPIIEELLDVPFYVEIAGYDKEVVIDCETLNDNCDPLMGGIQIVTEKSTLTGSQSLCSYSIPAVQGTTNGFVTAGHCFDDIFHYGNDVWQPTPSSKIGDLLTWAYSGECDCAFVEKVGSEAAWFGAWDGNDQFEQLSGDSDPLVGSYVIMVGHNSGINIGKVVSNTHDSYRSWLHTVDNTLKIDWHVVQGGDSGGIVYDWLTESQYNGMISAAGSTYSVAIPWSHIQAGLNLQ